MEKIQEVCDWLTENGIEFEKIDHGEAHTMEDVANLHLEEKGHICKNLFMRDLKAKRHFLVTLCADKEIGFQKFEKIIGVKVRLGSEDRLLKYCNLTAGSVTPLGVFFDKNTQIEIILDEDLKKFGKVGVHPCYNSSTVFLNFEDLEKLVRSKGNKVKVIPL
jgi:Ala-tRNA(Pro) deacylase